MKKVSIAIMCYNQESFIRETIESALNQTYKNIEICISDDCSTDNTYKIILEYKDKYTDKIKCFQQKENMGKVSLCINANSMFNLCTWEYITLLDWDDIMLPDRIQKQVDFLEINPEYIWVSWWVEAFNSKTWKSLWNIHKNLNVNKRDLITLITYGNSIPPCLMFRNVYNKPKYDEKLKIMWDWLLYIELSMIWKIWHLDEYLWKYRIHDNNSINKDLSYDQLLTLDIIKAKYPQYSYFANSNKCVFLIWKWLNKILIEKEYINWWKLLLKSIKISPLLFIKQIISLTLKKNV